MSLAEDLDRDTLADVVFPPSELWSDEPPLETDLHLQQMIMLLNSLNWWWRDRDDFYVLLDGCYQALVPNPQGWLWSQQLELYLGTQAGQLRFFNAEGRLLLSGEEAAVLAQQHAEQERQQKELAQQQAEHEALRAERLAAKLQELNIDPDAL